MFQASIGPIGRLLGPSQLGWDKFSAGPFRGRLLGAPQVQAVWAGKGACCSFAMPLNALGGTPFRVAAMVPPSAMCPLMAKRWVRGTATRQLSQRAVQVSSRNRVGIDRPVAVVRALTAPEEHIARFLAGGVPAAALLDSDGPRRAVGENGPQRPLRPRPEQPVIRLCELVHVQRAVCRKIPAIRSWAGSMSTNATSRVQGAPRPRVMPAAPRTSTRVCPIGPIRMFLSRRNLQWCTIRPDHPRASPGASPEPQVTSRIVTR